MSDRKFRYSYRIRIKEEGTDNAVEIGHAMNNKGPTNLEDIETVMKGAVSRALQAVCPPTTTTDPEPVRGA